MGNEQSRGPRFMTREQQVQVNTFPTGLDMERDAYTANCLTRFSILNPADAEKQLVQDKIFGPNGFDTPGEDRAMGCFLGMPVGDSLGAPLEFSPVRYGSTELKEMGQEDVWFNPRYNRFRLRPGQWTDDASMGLCIADSLLVNQGFNPLDLRLRFLNWWEMGYNNAFGYEKVHEVPADEEHEPEQKDKPETERTGGGRTSVGLGGNISQSFREFKIKRTEYTTAGDRFTSGNGSVMRLAAVPIYYANNHDQALDVAYKHSKTTHQGDEAAECCRLMSHIIVTAINYPEPGPVPKSILENIPESFESPLYSVNMLAASKQEERHRDNEDTADLANRNWNWKDPNFRFSPQRAKEQPGYIGSYSMDALAMALHCVYTTDNFRDALLKTVNLRGDSDSVGAVAGQIAGAMYGVREIPRNWIEAVQKWDNGGNIALRGYKLYTHHAL